MWFEVFADGDGVWRWRLRSETGRDVALSAEGYAAKAQCLYDIALTMQCATAQIREIEPMVTTAAERRRSIPRSHH